MNGNGDAPWTVSRLLAWTRDYLQQREIASAKLCAEVLLAHAMDCERLQLFTHYSDVPPPAQLTRFREMVREAATGKPISYIVGTKDFYSLRFAVTPDVLIPRPETETLVERAISLIRAKSLQSAPIRILDIGSGSGCIAVSLAKNLPDAQVFASDLSEAALAVAKQNAATHNVADRIYFRAGSVFEPWANETFTLIVSNPPYVGTALPNDLDDNVRDYEPHVALFSGDDGLDIIRTLVTAAPKHLTDDGDLLMEIAFDQAAAVRDLCQQAGWPHVQSYKDLAGHERVIHAARTAAVNHPQEEARGIVA